MIGDLEDKWATSDYEKFYSVAKWLSLRGFRTILNVAAYEPDLQEAVSNEKTTAIIWNSHGSKEGAIFDKDKSVINDNTFVDFISPSLKYVLFANCWGFKSIKKYALDKPKGLTVQGWERVVTSKDLFDYIFSKDFDQSLSDAIGKDITKKQTKRIEL